MSGIVTNPLTAKVTEKEYYVTKKLLSNHSLIASLCHWRELSLQNKVTQKSQPVIENYVHYKKLTKI